MPIRPLTDAMIAEYERLGAWQRRALYEIVDEHAARDPQRLAVADQHDRLTYAELVEHSRAVAAWLQELDLEPGDVVAVQAANRVAFSVTHLACDRADLTFLPLSPAYRETELRHLLGTSRAKVLVVQGEYHGYDLLGLAQILRPELPDLLRLGTVDEPGADASAEARADFSFAEIARSGRTERPVDRDPNAPRYVMVTSGTTSVPQMSLWTDNNLWFFMQQYISRVGMERTDIAVGLAPASTGGIGYVYPVLAPMLHGATSVLLEDWAPEEAVRLIASERATLATAVPTQIIKMLLTDAAKTTDLSSLRVFTNAGAALPRSVAEEMEATFGCISHVCYGTTDGGVPALATHTDPPEKRFTTVGSLTDFGEVRIVDPAGEDVGVGEVGELLWRGPTKTFGYLGDDARTDAAFEDDGWYRSGDLARLDADNHLAIVGRAKDVIIRGGQNISPAELEEMIIALPQVAEVSVVGIPDPVYGERVCACVVLREGETLDLPTLVSELSGRGVAAYKLPERLELFADLPRSSGGKITKVALREAVTSRA